MTPAEHWTLDERILFLNHGSFGACPRAVLEHQQRLRDRMERQPVQFFVRDLEGLLDGVRAELGAFVGADAQDLVWVPNATSGVNAVLGSLELRADDELLVTDHAYNACRNALDHAARRAGSRVVVAQVPFPLETPERVVDSVLDRATPRTRLALVDHVTSQTGLVLPIARLVRELAARGIDTLVDGAHAPGMVELDLADLGAAYYAGNCHKWLCAPKGAGFLYVRRDLQPRIRPAVISHGASTKRTDRSRFRVEFDWVGTADPTAVLSVGAALRFMGERLTGGWPALRAHNRGLALAARRALCDALDVAPPCPEEMIGSLAAVPLPDGDSVEPPSPLYNDPLQRTLRERFAIEVPVIAWPAPPRRLIRVSAQLYNRIEQYETLAAALRELF